MAMAMAMAADSGGSGYVSISSIINETCPMTAAVLSTPKIQKENVISAISTLKQDVTSNQEFAQTLMDDVRAVLAATNSNRFYSGEIATTQRGYIDTIDEDFDKIVSILSNIDVSKIGTIIDKYNTKLVLLKKQTRLKLLQDKADAINAQDKIIETRQYDEQYAADAESSGALPSVYRSSNVDDLYLDEWSAYVTNITDAGWPMQNYHWTYTRKIRIKYWVGIKCIDPFQLDDDAAKLEQKLLAVGESLPYTSLVDMD